MNSTRSYQFLKKICIALSIISVFIFCFTSCKKTEFEDIKDELSAKIDLEEDIGGVLYDNNFERGSVSDKEADKMLSFLAEELKTVSLDYMLDILVDLVANDFEITKLDDTIILLIKEEQKIDEVAHFLKYLEKYDWLINYQSNKIKTEISEYVNNKYSELLLNDFPVAFNFYIQAKDSFAGLTYYTVKLPSMRYSVVLNYLSEQSEVIYTSSGLGGYYDEYEDQAAPTPPYTTYSYTTYHGDFKCIHKRTSYYNQIYEICYKTENKIYYKEDLIIGANSIVGRWYKCGDYLYHIEDSGTTQVLLTSFFLKGYLVSEIKLSKGS